jgi:hypothetical protein
MLYDLLKADVNGSTKLALIQDFDQVLSLNLIDARMTDEGMADGQSRSPHSTENRRTGRRQRPQGICPG